MRKLALLFILAIIATSCVTTDRCNVKINKKKFKYYNNLQYGGNSAYINKVAKKKK